MRHWTLRTRLTLWSAICFAAAVTLLGVFTLALVRQHQVEGLDAELRGEMRSFFHELDEHGPAGAMQAAAGADKATRSLVLGPGGELLWASPDWKELPLAPETGPGVQTAGSWRVVSATENGYTVRVARGFQKVEATVADVRHAYFTALPLLLVLLGGGVWLLVRAALHPVQVISDTARRITTEHLDERLPTPARHDELGQLTGVLNQMLDRLDRGYHQAIRFTADASHELCTPLALMAAGLEQLLRRHDLPPGVTASLASLLEDHRRLTAVCQDLLLLARADAGCIVLERQPHDLRALLGAAVEDARILAAESAIRFDLTLPDHAEASVDARYFTRIALNLLSNAVKYNRPGGRIRIRLTAEAAAWVLEIANTGAGIAPEHQARLFDRFFRTDSAAAVPGHGLGLSLSRELARAHGGELVLRASDSEWTSFRLTLPRTWRENTPGSGQPVKTGGGENGAAPGEWRAAIREA